jgi:hypothetical protein
MEIKIDMSTNYLHLSYLFINKINPSTHVQIISDL